MRHREEIDGLRAVAVVPIVLFHAGVSRLSGGFVGVDIFFVISGFLITRIVFDEFEQNTFSIATFYKRRVVRIAPALMVMLAAVLVAGWFALLPAELRALAESAAATAGFASNLYFWSTADYFAQAAESMPLLHTWSLGVEEQFYLFYPALLLVVRRFARSRVRLLLFFVSAGSFAYSIYLTKENASAAFYLLPARAWELGLGALVALGAFPTLSSMIARTGAAVSGLLLIGAGYFLIRADMAFPAPWAALPCAGAVLFLAYGEQTLAGKALSSLPIRLIGKISYSLYLWHWPIITFYRLEYGGELDRIETLALTAASFVAAILSYSLIERPLLRGFRAARWQVVLPIGLGALSAMIVVPFLMVASSQHSATLRFGRRVRQIASYLDYKSQPDFVFQFRPGPCFRENASRNLPFLPDYCVPLRHDRPNVIVLGDSHAAQYWRAFARRYPGANVLQATASGCRPTAGGAGQARCREVVDYVLNSAVPSGRVDTLILAGRWEEQDIALVGPTINQARSKVRSVVVIGPTAEYDMDFPRIAARGLQMNDPAWPGRFLLEDRNALDREMAQAVAGTGAVYVSALNIECPRGVCRQFAPDGAPLQWDYGHLTLSGAEWVVSQMPDFAHSNQVASAVIPSQPKKTFRPPR